MMKVKLIILLSLVFIGSMNLPKVKAQFTKTASCENPEFDRKVDSYLKYSTPVIGVKEAYGQKSKYIFLDARETPEFTVSHIQGARHIGYDHFILSSLLDIPKDKPIIVYCSIGYRSEKIATKMRKAGYKNVFNLYGSIFEWANQGYPVYSGKSQVYKVHAYNKKWSKWMMNKSYTPVY